MIFTMLIGLYTSRVVLSALGASDFGIYEVVGGVVTLFSFLNGTMAAATQRFLTFEIGRDNQERLKNIFSVSLSIHLIICLVVIVLAETIGLWFLNTKLNIPADRLEAANWVYQLSILACIFSITQVPYDALIIAREKMNVFAYVSIYGAVVKLALVILLSYLSYDKLIWYALFLLFKNVSVLVISRVYSIRNFDESKFKLVKELSLYKEIGSFAGWNLSGHCVNVAKTQGVNMVLNIFFGPIANAARGVALQVQGVLMQLVDNFQMATVPQITKSYAAGDTGIMNSLIIRSSKLSVFLLTIVMPPFIIEADNVLQLWLGEVPEYCVVFTRLSLIAALVNSFSGLLVYGALATGEVKRYQLIMSVIFLMQFFLTLLFFEQGFSPEWMYITEIIIYAVGLFARLFLLKSMVRFPVVKYMKEVVFLGIVVIVLTCIVPTYIYHTLSVSIVRLVLVMGTSCIGATIFGIFVIFNSSERNAVKKLVLSKLNINND